MNRLKRCFPLLVAFFLIQNLAAQDIESGDLVATLGTLIDEMPGDTGDDYAPPTNLQLTNWETCLIHLLQKEYSSAESIANQLDYDLIQFTDSGNNQIYYILGSQSASSNLWGTYVFNPSACQSNLVIQSPHPRNDTNTGDQGILILKDVGALFYMVAGTHRCNSDTFSSCSGTTTTCDNGLEAYRESDMAHIDNSIFHKTTEILLDKLADPYFIQLHGFSKNEDDPYLILSNGTTNTPATDYLSQLGDALVNIDNTLTFKVAHITPSIRLKGTTNTQGRLINGSGNPCSSAASMNSGRFLHIEQERTKLRADATGWQKMADALKVVFRNVDLSSSTLNLNHYAAYDSLHSKNIISSGATINFQSSKAIQLTEGFHAENGSVFNAKVEDCGSTNALQSILPLPQSIYSATTSFLKVAPNPFVGHTTISYQLDKSQTVTLEVYDATGRLAERLVDNDFQERGIYNYSFRAKKNNSVSYFVILKMMDYFFVEKVIRMK